jgi:hypothetical protein
MQSADFVLAPQCDHVGDGSTVGRGSGCRSGILGGEASGRFEASSEVNVTHPDAITLVRSVDNEPSGCGWIMAGGR